MTNSAFVQLVILTLNYAKYNLLNEKRVKAVKNIIFKSKLNNTYIYNDTTGLIFHIDDVENIPEFLEPYEKLRRSLIVQPLHTPNTVKNLLYQQARGFNQLILEVTTSCNFRCKYCIYSDHYATTRKHGFDFMTIDTAQKAVDYFFKGFSFVRQRDALKIPTITFYGGEPLLKFELIKDIVAYVNRKYPNITTKYSITTNGSLLTDEIGYFLSQHDFSVLISLDGYKENHDRNRVDVNGNKTFDLVFAKYQELKKNYPKLDVEISCCYDFKTNMQKLATFLDENEIALGMLSQVDPVNSTFYDQFSVLDRNSFQKSYKIEFEKFVDCMSNVETAHKLSVLGKWFYKLTKQLSTHPVMENSNSSCIPGEKIYVCANGNFKICEKVSDSFNIGDVYSGLDFEKICSLLNQFQRFKLKRCENCEISHMCTVCFHDCCIDEYAIVSQNFCSTTKQAAQQFLAQYVNISEQNPFAYDDQTNSYYSTCLGEVM